MTDRMEAPAYVATMTEEAFQGTIIDAAKLNGWRVFFIPDWIWKLIFALMRKGKIGRGKRWAEPGFPDLILCRPPRLVVAEVKSAGGQVREVQAGWLADLQACGIDARVWKPKDWSEIEELIRNS